MHMISRNLHAPRPGAAVARAGAELLERRVLFALTVQIDYSFDTNNFFDTQEKRDLLQAAADTVVASFRDRLDAINPGGGNTWKAIIDDPSTAGTREVDNPVIPVNTLLVYAGGREMTSLGMGGPGGFSSAGTPEWNNRVATRGQSNARGDGARDFGPWGGSIVFDTSPAAGWYFGLDEAGIAGRTDFYAVALHEMTHLLGFGTSDAWETRVRGGTFTGPAATNENGGVAVPLGQDQAHWASGTTNGGREAAMDPDLTTGTRKVLTPLDLAAMDDIGWDVALLAAGNDAVYADASGDVVTVKLKGPGSAKLTFDTPAGENADARGILVSGTTDASILTITATGAGTTIGGLTVNGPLRSLSAKNVDLAGTMSVDGGLPRVQLRNASGSIAIGAGGATSITLAQARDLTVTSASAVKSVRAAEWLDTDATPDALTAPSFSALAVKGGMAADVKADTIGKVSAGGTLSGAEIRATSSIGTVTVASAADSFVFAGVRPDLLALPDSLDDFVNPAASIRSVTLKAKGAPFSNTRVAAPTIGKAVLGNATVGTMEGNPFGLAADRLTSVMGATNISGVYKLAKRDQPGTGLGSVDFAIVVL